MIFKFLPAIAALTGISVSAFSQQTATTTPYSAVLNEDRKPLETGKVLQLDLLLTDSKSMEPCEGITVKASLSMPEMAGMMIDPPKVTNSDKPGHFQVTLRFPHTGKYRLDFAVASNGAKTTVVSFTISPEDRSPGMKDGEMRMQMIGSLSEGSASREGSGTSWQPVSSPMFMKMLPSLGGFELSTMGTVQAGYVDPGSRRVGAQFFTDSMIMLMGRKEAGGGTIGLDFMTSLDPIINGERGVPDLFQTGETAHGVPLVDRQHPHNLFSEVAASYSHPLSPDWSGFVYGGPVGEPALGNVMFMHRPSGMEIPEAPITHHWFDSTHISFGVVTLGLVYKDRWKLDGSVFNGREPGENRYTIGPESLNSASGRLSYNPSKDWSLSTSYGFLASPEALSPGVDQHRLTVSAAYSRELPRGDNLSATAYYGQILNEGNPTPSNGWLAEATYYHAKDSIFARFERVEKDELSNVPPGDYAIDKLLFGDVHNFFSKDQIEYGFGAYGGVYSFPGSLDRYYGKSPFTFGVFLRVRPSKM